MKNQIDRQAEMLKIIEDARATYANDVTDHTENEYIREGLLNANYRKTEDVAMEIFAEIKGSISLFSFTDEGVDYEWGVHDALEWVDAKIAELKKKYESEGA